jgi:acetoin utilization deacetylase AcuC-like enzyme
MASKFPNDPDAKLPAASPHGEIGSADVKKARAALRKVETQLRFRQCDLNNLEEKVRAADVHLNRLKRMAGEYPSATWENEMLNVDAEKALRSLMVFAQSLQQFNSDTVYPINLQLLDQLQLAANGLVELIHHFMATHRQAEKPVPIDP